MKLWIYQLVVLIGFVQIGIGVLTAEVCVYRSKVFAIGGAQPLMSDVSIRKSFLHAMQSLGWMLVAVALIALCVPVGPAYAGFLWAMHGNKAFLALVGVEPTSTLNCDPISAARLGLGKIWRNRP